MSPPTYDFITDSYEPSKPYELNVSASQRVESGKAPKSQDEEMVDFISFLGGEEPKKETPRAIGLSTKNAQIDFSAQPKVSHQVEIKLQDNVPGKILNDQKAATFLDRVEYYVRNPSELTA